MQKVSSSLIRSVSASQILKGDAADGQVLSYSELYDSWIPVDQIGSADTLASYLPDSQISVVDSSIGQNWVLVDSTVNNSGWTSIAISSSGKYQTAVGNLSGIIISDTYGGLWNSTFSSITGSWTSVDMSADGKYQVACTNQYIYGSSNFGSTWTQKVATNGSARNWSCVRLSHRGKLQVATINSVINGYVYKSEDYGNTWSASLSSIGAKSWTSIGISFDGKYQTAAHSGGSASQSFYRSTDFGESWSVISDPVLPITPGTSYVDMSDDGKYQTIIRNGQGFVFSSQDYGISWTAVPIPDNTSWGSVTVAGNGKLQLITTSPATIGTAKMFISIDWGSTWNLLPSPIAQNGIQRWADTAMSSDGKILIALERTTGAYRSYADSQLNGSLMVTDTIRASAIYGTFYGDASNLIASGVGVAGTAVTELTGDGSTRTFTISSSFNGADKGRYIVSVGGLDQPSQFWSVSSTQGGRLTFVEAPRNGEVISIRSIVGNGYPTVYSFKSQSIGYGSKTFVTTTNWASFETGVLVTAYAGPDLWMSGRITSVISNSATVNMTSICGGGSWSNWTIRYGFALNMSPVQPTTGNSLIFNGSTWTPGNPTVVLTTNATQIQSRNVSPNEPQAGYMLGWAGSEWTPSEVDAIKIQGRYIDFITSPEEGHSLVWDGLSNQWTPKETNATKIQSRHISTTSPANGQSLVWNSTADFWEPQTPEGLRAWNTEKSYSQGDVVYDINSFGLFIYSCVLANAGQLPYNNSMYWKQLNASAFFIGTDLLSGLPASVDPTGFVEDGQIMKYSAAKGVWEFVDSPQQITISNVTPAGAPDIGQTGWLDVDLGNSVIVSVPYFQQ